MNKLLIVEDDKGIQTQLKWGLSKDFEVHLASTRQEALDILHRKQPPVVALDLGLPPHEDGVTEGMACLQEIIKHSPRTKVIVVTGNEDRENALQSVELGAYDFYQKPIDMDVLRIILQRAFNLARLEYDNEKLKEQVSESHVFENMLGHCSQMQEVFHIIRKVASTEATVLITGASGTGKELVARAIHYRSLRKKAPMVVINCGAIPENLIESELFGHEKGAFTDAKSRKIGLVEKAAGGTLFLDEIGELPLPLQVRLLRFIQERNIQRVGGTEPIDVDMRIIAATNTDLGKAVKEGRLREDLYFRISVIQIHLPPLRDRGDDVLMLAGSFLSRFTRENNKQIKGFTSEATAALQSFDWPGNVRELENKIQRAVIMTEGQFIDEGDLALPGVTSDLHKTFQAKTLKEARAQAERDLLQKSLISNGGNISKTAKQLEMSRPTLHALIKKYGLKIHES